MENWNTIASLFGKKLYEPFKINNRFYSFTSVGVINEEHNCLITLLGLVTGNLTIDNQSPINVMSQISIMLGLQLDKLYKVSYYTFALTCNGVVIETGEGQSYLHSQHLEAALLYSLISQLVVAEEVTTETQRNEARITYQINSIIALLALGFAAALNKVYPIVVYCLVTSILIFWNANRELP